MNKQIRSALDEALGDESAIIFDNPDFDNAIIGITTDNRVVYDYDQMVRQYIEDYCDDIEIAMDDISYNTLRALDYITDERKPIVIYSIENWL